MPTLNTLQYIFYSLGIIVAMITIYSGISKLMYFRKRRKTKFENHFRKNYNKTKGHPTYVFGEDQTNYHYVGLTHASKTRGENNVKLKHNPNPSDSKVSYIRPFSDKDKKKNFHNKPLKGWKVHKSDKRKVRKSIKNKKR